MTATGRIRKADGGHIHAHNAGFTDQRLAFKDVLLHDAQPAGVETQFFHKRDIFRAHKIALVSDIAVVEQVIGLPQNDFMEKGVGFLFGKFGADVKTWVDGSDVDHLLTLLVG